MADKNIQMKYYKKDGSYESLYPKTTVDMVIGYTPPIFPTVIVTAPTGSTMTCSKGSTTLTADEVNGTWTFVLPDYGTWVLHAEKGAESRDKSVVVNSVSLYQISIKYFDPIFSNNDWADIIDACHTNAVPLSWVVADHKNMTIGGTNYRIAIIGTSHDAYTAGGTAPLTFQLHDCLNARQQMNSSDTNVGGWKGCAMRWTHLPAIFETLPPEVRAGIRKVNKKTSAGNKSATIETSSDALFLLSEVEIFGNRSNSKPGEGSQYAYYQAGNSRVKKVSGTADDWWERSPFGSYATLFCYVNSGGDADGYGASGAAGVAFGFCF